MLDAYSLKARLWPALLAGLPAAAAVAVAFPGVDWRQAGVIGGGTTVGLTFLLAQLARSAGKRKEPSLYAKWGGKPTTRYLRHRDSPLDAHTLARYHRNVEVISPDLRMPTAASETVDPAGADTLYDAATRALINKTRDRRRFTLLFKENVHYGFCRNLWGLKPVGVCIAIAACAASTALAYHDRHAATLPANAIVACLSLVWVLLWLAWLTPGWVRVPADAYAERLLEASDALMADEAGEATGPQKPGR